MAILEDDTKPAAPTTPTIALALGAGGARGFAHLHALMALDDLGIRPIAIAGTSIGSIIGAGYASGMSGKEISEFMLNTLGRRAEVAARLWKLRPKGLGGVREGFNGLGRVDIESLLKVFLPESLPKNFEALKTPLFVVATDYYGQQPTIFKSGTLLPALASSAAIPAVFRPIMHEGRILIDGGITNPVPFDVVAGLADITIAIDVVGGPVGLASRLPTPIDLLFGSTQLLMQAIIKEKLEIHTPEIFLRPNVDKFRVLDFLKVKEILNQTKSFRDDVKRAVDVAMTSGSNL